MKPIQLLRAIPNEQFQLTLEFAQGGYRLFDLAKLYTDQTRSILAYPQYAKNFLTQHDGLFWPQAGKVDAGFLYQHSHAIQTEVLVRQILRLSYKNQAPDSVDAHHHVYSVFLAPFSQQMFRLDESIGGGHAERGGGQNLTLAELLQSSDWQNHMILAGCSWALHLILTQSNKPELLLQSLIAGACQRNGQAET